MEEFALVKMRGCVYSYIEGIKNGTFSNLSEMHDVCVNTTVL